MQVGFYAFGNRLELRLPLNVVSNRAVDLGFLVVLDYQLYGQVNEQILKYVILVLFR